jgi:hypothetical protein
MFATILFYYIVIGSLTAFAIFGKHIYNRKWLSKRSIFADSEDIKESIGGLCLIACAWPVLFFMLAEDAYRYFQQKEQTVRE